MRTSPEDALDAATRKSTYCNNIIHSTNYVAQTESKTLKGIWGLVIVAAVVEGVVVVVVLVLTTIMIFDVCPSDRLLFFSYSTHSRFTVSSWCWPLTLLAQRCTTTPQPWLGGGQNIATLLLTALGCDSGYLQGLSSLSLSLYLFPSLPPSLSLSASLSLSLSLSLAGRESGMIINAVIGPTYHECQHNNYSY